VWRALRSVEVDVDADIGVCVCLCPVLRAWQAVDGVSIGSEDFTCSQEQMLDLLASVRDATKQVERILSSD